MPRRFTQSSKRRTSILSGSLSRAGLFVPQDFVKNEDFTAVVTSDDLGEDEPLLTQVAPEPSVPDETVSEEAKLLQANKFPIRRYSAVESGPIPDADDREAIDESWEEALREGKITTTRLFELQRLFLSSIPLVVTFLLENSLGLCSIFAVGHISPQALAGITLGTMSCNISALAIICGLASSLDTFLPQAYGAGKYKVVGLIFQRCSALIFTIMAVVCVCWWIWAEVVLIKILPDEESAKLAATYLRVITFGLPGYIFFETGKRFLQAQGIFQASTYVLFVCAPLNALLNYLLVWVFKFGYVGAPIAVSINYTLMALGLLTYTITTNNEVRPLRCWNGLTLEKAFSNWKELIKLSIPNLIMIMSEFLGFEILTLLSSYLGTVPLAAQSVITTMASLTYQVPYGVSIAASTRVANYLGAELPKEARIAAKMVFVLTAFIAVVDTSLLLLGRRQIANLFSNNKDVIEVVSSVLPLVAFIQVFDALNATSAGCLRGQGLQRIGGLVNLVSYYVIGIPLGFFLSFYFPKDHPLGLFGLWTGFGVALLIIGAIQSYYVISADYIQLVKDAVKRSNTH
ncbi:hypothetical protein OGAPHI_006552 [Ogataea philodendri]|uniref:Ethionine resistance protein n=1 Tax=Ogataea philodendri TaxID=1378263 RepID=A0A9P8T1I0_9ASCO|nr:uncharacterized protein OGAPHI_006552 [Ogataea philodendri]KAH3661701.1 hypothetical protein OGAPHI_006552 [Ogataea philodendri]